MEDMITPSPAPEAATRAPPSDNFCSGKAGGLYAKADAAGSFYSCANGLTWVQNCAPGLVFRESCKCCDWE